MNTKTSVSVRSKIPGTGGLSAILFAGLIVCAPMTASADVLFSSRFESGPLAEEAAFTPRGTGGAKATVALTQDGSIDTYYGPRTGAVTMTVDTRPASVKKSAAGFVTRDIDVTNTEAELGKLTLGFNLWVSRLRPVRVAVTSVGTDGNATGTLTKILFPPVAGAYYRFTPDLGTFSKGVGTFDAPAAKLRVAFEVAAEDHPLPDEEFVLKIDNLSYASPTYYVSPTGNNFADGRSEATAFATIATAVERAQPGDVIMIGGGECVSVEGRDLVDLKKAGEPDKWITFRAAPGQTPVLRGTGWNVIGIHPGAAYLEFRGLTIQGYARETPIELAHADEAIREKDGKPYYGDAKLNTNGVGVDARKAPQDARIHHLRFIDNTIRDMGGAGFGCCAADYITFENNTVRDNCHNMRYAGSGISMLTAWNFDNDTGYKLFVIGNRSHGNRCFVKWTQIGKVSDGNGIIIDQFIDYNYTTKKASDHPYVGRTMVQNNLVFNNGGSGIHAFASNHVDIVNNTAYHNAQSPELKWRQIFAGSKCKDVRIINNILWAQNGRPIHTGMGDSYDVLYANNLMFGDGDNGVTEGGGLGTSVGGKQAEVIGHRYADPKFVRPTTNPTEADFRLQPDSPAIGSGQPGPLVPLRDIDGNPRPVDAAPNVGAFQSTEK